MAYQKICISSGHGLYVRGASSKWLDEVDEARRLVEHLCDVLDSRGIKVIEYHDNVSKNQDANLTAIVNAHNKAAPDLNISVHFNASDSHEGHGVEVLYKTQEQLANNLSASIAKAGQLTNRGGKYRDNLKFLNSTHGPAVLLEVCFCDHEGDCKLYNEKFGEICEAIVDVLAGKNGDEVEPPPIDEVETDEPLFYARGKCSHFGGPEDTGVSASEGLAFIYSLDETNQHLFLPLQPKGTTGLARRLNAKAVHYLAVRWDYDVTPKEMLASQKYVAMVTVPSTGLRLTAWPADWGPHEEKTGGRVADLSPALMADLELETDDEVIVEFPWQG